MKVGFINVSIVRIQDIGIEADRAIGFLGVQPSLFHGDFAHVGQHRGPDPFAHRPVITVVGNSGNDLLQRNFFQSEPQIVDVPILGCHRADVKPRGVLIVIHQDQPISLSCQEGIIEIGVMRWKIEIELHAAAVQLL